MTIKQSADDAAVEHTRKSLVIFLCTPLGNDLAVFRKAAYMQSLFIRRTAAEADAIW